MFTLFRRKKASPSQTEAPSPLSASLLQPSSGDSLLGTARRQKLLEHIWQRTSLSREQFDALYQAPIARYAALVQQFPASEYHHHAYHGGMLDHGLESVAYALKLRQSYLLPVGATPEAQAAQSEAWSACAAYAALLHDVGKIAVDLHVEYAGGTAWHPWHGALDRPYRFRYRNDRAYRLHAAATGLLYVPVLGQRALDWLHGFPELWSALLYVLSGQYESAGVLGELVIQADKASVAQELGGNPQAVHAAPKQALQRKLLDGLRYLIKGQLNLNQPEASDGWLTQEALWLVSKTVCDKLRAHLLSLGTEGIPESNTAVFNILQDHGIAQPTGEGKAIWRATVTSATGWTHSFTFLRLAPSLIWEAAERPPLFEGTVRSEGPALDDRPASGAKGLPSTDSQSTASAVSGESLPDDQMRRSISADRAPLAELDSALAPLEIADASSMPTTVAENVNPPEDSTPQVSVATTRERGPVLLGGDSPGAQFFDWLREAIATRHLKINDARALVHSVAGTAYLLSPGVFQRYIQEHPQFARAAARENPPRWETVQKSFEKLCVHMKQRNGLNIWTCEVTGPRRTRRVHGYLLADGSLVFADLPPDNPYLKLLDARPPKTDA